MGIIFQFSMATRVFVVNANSFQRCIHRITSTYMHVMYVQIYTYAYKSNLLYHRPLGILY